MPLTSLLATTYCISERCCSDMVRKERTFSRQRTRWGRAAGRICVISLLVCARGKLTREVDSAPGPARARVPDRRRQLYWLARETAGNDTEYGAGHGTFAE